MPEVPEGWQVAQEQRAVETAEMLGRIEERLIQHGQTLTELQQASSEHSERLESHSDWISSAQTTAYRAEDKAEAALDAALDAVEQPAEETPKAAAELVEVPAETLTQDTQPEEAQKKKRHLIW